MLPEVLTEIYSTKTTHTADGTATPLRASVSLAEATLLYELVRETQPKCSLEVGLGQGMSTIAILGAIKDNGFGHHHVIDPWEASFEDAGLAAIERAGLTQYMTFHRTHSELVIPSLPEIGFAFIDASHLFDLTLADFVLIDKKLHRGGIIGFHDSWLPSYGQLLDYVLSNREYKPYNWTPRQPFTGWRKRLSRFIAKRSALRRIFSPRLLPFAPSSGAPNLSVIQKIARDKRNWDFHVPF